MGGKRANQFYQIYKSNQLVNSNLSSGYGSGGQVSRRQNQSRGKPSSEPNTAMSHHNHHSFNGGIGSSGSAGGTGVMGVPQSVSMVGVPGLATMKAGSLTESLHHHNPLLLMQSQLEEVKEELREQQLSSRQNIDLQSQAQIILQGGQGNQGGQGGQGMQGACLDGVIPPPEARTAALLEAVGTAEARRQATGRFLSAETDFMEYQQQRSKSNQNSNQTVQNLERIEKKIDLIMQNQNLHQKITYGQKFMMQSQRKSQKDWRKAKSLYQRGERIQRIVEGLGDTYGLNSAKRSLVTGSLGANVASATSSRGEFRDKAQQLHASNFRRVGGTVPRNFNAQNTQKQLAKTAKIQSQVHSNEMRLKTAGQQIQASMQGLERSEEGGGLRRKTGEMRLMATTAEPRSAQMDFEDKDVDNKDELLVANGTKTNCNRLSAQDNLANQPLGLGVSEPLENQQSNHSHCIPTDSATKQRGRSNHLEFSQGTRHIDSDLQNISEYLNKSKNALPKGKGHLEKADYRVENFRMSNQMSDTTESNRDNMNNFESKIKNLKKMYNQQVKNDYTISGNKTSIRNKKKRISHDMALGSVQHQPGATTASATTGVAGGSIEYSTQAFEKQSQDENRNVDRLKKSKEKKNKLLINDAYQESQGTNRKQTSLSRQSFIKRQAAPQTGTFVSLSDRNQVYGPNGGGIKKYVNPKKYPQLFSPNHQNAQQISMQLKQNQQLQPIQADKGHHASISVPSHERQPLAPPVIGKNVDKMIAGSRHGARFAREPTSNQMQISQAIDKFNTDLEQPSVSQPLQPTQNAKEIRKQIQKQKKDAIQSIYLNPFKLNLFPQVMSQSQPGGGGSGSKIYHAQAAGQAQTVNKHSYGRYQSQMPARQGMAASVVDEIDNARAQKGQRGLDRPHQLQNVFPKGAICKNQKLNPLKGLEPLCNPPVEKGKNTDKITKGAKYQEIGFCMLPDSPRYDERRSNEEIEDVSDYEEEGERASPDSDAEKPLKTCPGADHRQKSAKRVERSDYVNQMLPGQVLSHFGVHTAPLGEVRQKNSRSKFEAPSNPRERFRAKGLGGSGRYESTKINESVDNYLLAESKDREFGSPQAQRDLYPSGKQQVYDKIKQSPYNQAFNQQPGAASSLVNAFGPLGTGASLASSKQQISRRPPRGSQDQPTNVQNPKASALYGSPQNQLQQNYTRVQKAYKNYGAGASNPPKSKQRVTAKKTKEKEQLVKHTIDKINLKIDDLKENLNNYEQNFDLALRDIPKDIRSMNNSNFNNSSSRQCNQETDRQFDRFTHRTSNRNGGETKNILRDDLSEETLKTILDFHSDRAHTQQNRRNARQKPSYTKQGTQLTQQSQNLYQTSRESGGRVSGIYSGMNSGVHPILSGARNHTGTGDLYDLGIGQVSSHNLKQQLNINPLNNTHDYIQRCQDEEPVMYQVDSVENQKFLESAIHTLSGRKEETNPDLSNHIGSEGERRGTSVVGTCRDLPDDKSMVIMQNYYQQRGINNDTNLSAGLSKLGSSHFNSSAIDKPKLMPSITIPAAGITGLIPNRPDLPKIGSPTSQPGSQILSQNFYPRQVQSRLSQKSAICDITQQSAQQIKP